MRSPFAWPHLSRAQFDSGLGMLLELSAMHLFAAIRQAGPTWQDGTAIYYALRQGFWVTDLGVWNRRARSGYELFRNRDVRVSLARDAHWPSRSRADGVRATCVHRSSSWRSIWLPSSLERRSLEG